MVHFHYCMGKLADMGLGHSDSRTCKVCGMEKSDKEHNECCHDEYKFFKSSSDQKITESALQIIKPGVKILNDSCLEIISQEFSCLSGANLFNNAPPGYKVVPVFLFICNFRI
ncbi:MAG TPA: hypothetical protein VI548_01920 [Chitinophagaceae bacterium]|nr:hypothetical protein [Chitinophagaceae bacterium]